MKNYTLVIHGGAGTILKSEMTSSKDNIYKIGLENALNEGFNVLKNNGSALDAVTIAVAILEDNPLFNAGKGSVYSSKGKHEMDASIMDGQNLNAGAVCGIEGIKNPVKLARLVMEKSNHVLLSGYGALEFAKEHGIQQLNDDYFHNSHRFEQWQRVKESDDFILDHTPNKADKYGTVGAVALDQNGNLAAATSTGGMTNKKYGRIGDSPIIGSGNYANNKTCAISCTGSGEYFLRGVVAYDVSCLMEMKKLSLNEAAELTIHDRVKKIGGDGGLIAVDKDGNFALPFNTKGMYRGIKSKKGDYKVEIY